MTPDQAGYFALGMFAGWLITSLIVLGWLLVNVRDELR